MTPQLRFPDFVDEWRTKKLGDLSEITTGRLDANAMSLSGRYKFFTCAREVYSIDQYAFDTEALLISGNGANVGYIHYYNGKFNAYQRTYVLNEFKADIHYVKQYLDKKLKKRIFAEKFEGNTPYIVRGTLVEMQVTLPSKLEQEKVAGFMGAVDDKVAAIQNRVAAMHKYKKGVMQALFSGKLRFRDENGNPYPDWEEKKLGEITTRVTKKNSNNAIINVLTNSATQGIVNQFDYFDKDIANQNNLTGYYVVSKDDFVYNPRISQSAPVGPIKRNNLETGVMSPLYTVFRFTDGNIQFFEMYFNTNYWHEYMRSVANSGARHDRMNITTGDFYNVPVPFPCLEEQKKIADFLSAIDAKIELENKKLQQAKQFKKSLLQRMFV